MENEPQTFVPRVLGLDLGSKTIGVAVSDPLSLTAQGVTTLRRGSLADDLEALQGLANLYKAYAFVVGYPRNMDGSIGPQARQSEAFAEELRKQGWPVTLMDERLTTRIANQVLLEGGASRAKRREVIDQQAAIVILQGYLDRRNRQ